MLNYYGQELLSDGKKELIKRFILGKVSLLKEIIGEGGAS